MPHKPRPDVNFDNIATDYNAFYHNECLIAKRGMIELLTSWSLRKEPRTLALLGRSGTGKTTLLKEAYNFICMHNPKAQLWEWMKIVDHIRKGNYDIMDHLANVPFLFIDDIGVEYQTDLSRAKLAELIYMRMNRWTFYTSNLLYEEIADIDVRLSSRLIRENNKIFTFLDCPDWSEAHYTPLT